MNKNLRLLVLGFSVLGMGIAMPSCPGQEAMQAQIDALQTSQTDMTKKVAELKKEVNTMTTEVNQMKEIVVKMNSVIQEQSVSIQTLNDSMKDQKSKGGKKRGK